MIRSTTLLLCLLALFAGALSQECVQDWECGNVPYAICIGGLNECPKTINGLGIDYATNEIYFGQICRTESIFNNITFKKLGVEGGVPTLVETRQQEPAAANPAYTFDVVDRDLFISIQARAPGHQLTSLNLDTLTRSNSIATEGFFQNIIEFDLTNRNTYACNVVFGVNGSYHYEIQGFDGILGLDGISLPNDTLYNISTPSICSAVRVQGSDLYYTVVLAGESSYTTIFYKGSTDGLADAQPVFTVAARVLDFDLSETRIYYGTTSGVYSVNLAGDNTKHISWSAGANGVRILGDRVYWNSGSAILSDSLAGGDVQQLNTFSGTCGCRNGFSGSSCTACDGQIQWYEGIPRCIPLNEDGLPETCNFDYECYNSPYSYCSGSCKCRDTLTGSDCMQCADPSKTMTWVNGLPVCE